MAGSASRAATGDVTITTGARVDEALRDQVLAGLDAALPDDVPRSGRLPLAVLLRAPQGQLIGALTGRTLWGWLVIDLLWVDAPARGAILTASRRRGSMNGAAMREWRPWMISRAAISVISTPRRWPDPGAAPMTFVVRAPWLPAGAVALSAALWGLWWLPLRALAEAGLSGAAVNAALYGIASLALLPWYWRRRRRIAAGGLLLLGAGGLFGAALVAWNLALILGEVVRVTLLFYLAPVWATLLALAVLRERVGWLRAASVVLGLAGAGVLLGFAGRPPLPRSAGDWLGLAAGVLFALSITLVRKGQAIEGFEQTLVSFAAAAVLSLALLLLVQHQSSTADAIVFVWAAVAALAWLLPVTWLLLWGARFLEPGRVSLLLLLEVAVAAASAAFLAGEPFGLREAAGCVLIVAAGALEGWSELRPGRREIAALPPYAPVTVSDIDRPDD